MKDQNHIDRHFAASAIALATAIVASTNAAVVYRSVNLVVPATVDGVYLNVESGAFSTTATTPAGWDINPYGTSSTAISLFATTGTGYMRNPGAGTAAGATRLDLGTTIGSTAFYYGNTIANIGTGVGQWTANSTGYVGFRFVGGDSLVHYGWMHLSIGSNAGTRTIIDYAYESTAGVSIGTTPPCAGDVIRDNMVDGIDLGAILGAWGSTGGAIDTDVNNDGIVNGLDLAAVLSGWGPCSN